jgi:hypothetical protein
LLFCPAWSGPRSYVMLTAVAGITGTCHCAQLLVVMGSCELLLVLSLNHDPSNLTSKVARITGVSHCAQLSNFG